jgi:hypothetical protein
MHHMPYARSTGLHEGTPASTHTALTCAKMQPGSDHFCKDSSSNVVSTCRQQRRTAVSSRGAVTDGLRSVQTSKIQTKRSVGWTRAGQRDQGHTAGQAPTAPPHMTAHHSSLHLHGTCWRSRQAGMRDSRRRSPRQTPTPASPPSPPCLPPWPVSSLHTKRVQTQASHCELVS